MSAVSPSVRFRRQLWWLLPLAVTVVFVQCFARPMPMTDEWLYVHRLWKLHGIDWGTLAGWKEAIWLYPVQFSEHLVGVPFLFYWPLAEWTDFDSRWPIYVTVISFLGQIWLYRRYLVKDVAWVWAMPIAILMLSPARYMEFLWGWQITLSLSVFFPLAGLAMLDRIDRETPARESAWLLFVGVGCLLLGAFSSAGGFMGFMAALLLVMLKPWGWKMRALVVGAVAVFAALVYGAFLHDDSRQMAIGLRQVWQVLTALGAAIVGSPGGLMKFGFDLRSFVGLLIVLASLAVVVRAAWLRQLPKLALPLSFMVFGYLCVGSIALSRSYLGNWHVQYTLPAIGGVYAAAWVLRRVDDSRFAQGLRLSLALLLSLSLGAYVNAFLTYGPEYNAYMQRAERYVLNNLQVPDLEPPYPKQNLEMDAGLLLFLSAHEHPLFDALPVEPPVEALPAGARVYLDGVELAPPWRIRNDFHRTAFLTVTLPSGKERSGIVATLGDRALILRRVHPQHVPTGIPDESLETFYMGMLLPSRLPKGEISMQLQTFGTSDADPTHSLYQSEGDSWAQLTADPAAFMDKLGMNLFPGKMIPQGNPVSLKRSHKLRYLGSAGGHEIALNFGLYRLQGEMVAEIGEGFGEEAKARFEVISIEPGGPKAIWEDTMVITRETPRIVHSFAVSPGGNRVRLVAHTESGRALRLGWRALTVPHSGELDENPPVPFSGVLPEQALPAALASNLFAKEESRDWQVRAYGAGVTPTESGVKLEAPGELWIRVNQPRSAVAGRITIPAVTMPKPGTQGVRLQVVYYKSGRLHVIHQQDYSANTLRTGNVQHEFKQGLQEPFGWVGLILKPLDPAQPAGAVATWSDVKLSP